MVRLAGRMCPGLEAAGRDVSRKASTDGTAHADAAAQADLDAGGVTIRALDEQEAIRLLRDAGAID